LCSDSILGSTASLVGLVFVFHPTGQGFSIIESVLLGSGIVLTGLAVALELKDYLNHRPNVIKTKQQIRDYMFDWIDNGGKVFIFSNDLSWVEDEEMVSMLKRKAEKRRASDMRPDNDSDCGNSERMCDHRPNIRFSKGDPAGSLHNRQPWEDGFSSGRWATARWPACCGGIRRWGSSGLCSRQ